MFANIPVSPSQAFWNMSPNHLATFAKAVVMSFHRSENQSPSGVKMATIPSQIPWKIATIVSQITFKTATVKSNNPVSIVDKMFMMASPVSVKPSKILSMSLVRIPVMISNTPLRKSAIPPNISATVLNKMRKTSPMYSRVGARTFVNCSTIKLITGAK